MSTQTLGQALAEFRAANGIPANADTAPHWSVSVAGFNLRLRNRSWRRKAVLAHDIHHVLTGYPCTLVGEFQMAAWEAASGGFPNFGARCMCTPLILLGLILAPRRTLAAFRRGSRTRNLHRQTIDEAVLDRAVGTSGIRFGDAWVEPLPLTDSVDHVSDPPVAVSDRAPDTGPSWTDPTDHRRPEAAADIVSLRSSYAL